MAKYAFGIDLGGMSAKVGFFAGDGTLLEKWTVPTDTSDNGAHILPTLAKEIQAKVEEKNLALSDLAGVGMDVPGVVRGERIVNRCVNLGWGEFDAAAELEALLPGVLIKISNDANAAALGEYWQGGGQGYQTLVMITLGTGFGGGIILNGKIWEGVHGSAGEIGHTKINPEETEACGCGGLGCLEQYSSAMWVARQTKKALEKYEGKSVLKQEEYISSHTLFDAAKAGDKFAADFAEQTCKIIGTACANVAAIIDPEVFVIGGGMAYAGKYLLNLVTQYYRENALHAVKDTPLVLATLGNDAGMYGAVKTVL